MRPLGQTNTKIIQAALPLFVRQGYHGTSIRDIMQKVKITKAAFYSHFESKGQLLLRIIYDYEAKYIDQLIQIVNEYPGNAIVKLNRAISFSAEFAIKNLDLCLFLDSLTSELNGDVTFLPSLKKVYDKYQTFVRDTIALGIEEGVISSDLDPDLAALIYVGAHNGVLHQWRLNRYQLDGRKYVKTFRKILMDGLKLGGF
jgi:AcrR family transcriptional regulator